MIRHSAEPRAGAGLHLLGGAGLVVLSLVWAFAFFESALATKVRIEDRGGSVIQARYYIGIGIVAGALPLSICAGCWLRLRKHRSLRLAMIVGVGLLIGLMAAGFSVMAWGMYLKT